MKKRTRNRLATVLGFATSLITAVSLVDFDALDYSSVNTWVKLLVLLLPAIGGSVSSVNVKPSPDAN